MSGETPKRGRGRPRKPGVPDCPIHGVSVTYAYRTKRCRCEACRGWEASKQRGSRAAAPELAPYKPRAQRVAEDAAAKAERGAEREAERQAAGAEQQRRIEEWRRTRAERNAAAAERRAAMLARRDGKGMDRLRADVEAHGEEAIIDRIAAGETRLAIAADYGVPISTFATWLRSDPERHAAYQEAKRLSAEVHVRDALEIVDEAAAFNSTARVQAAKARAEFRRWMAGVRDPQYASGQGAAGVNVNLNIGQLHLDALRQLGAAQRPALPVLKAEVLEEDGDAD